MQRKSKFVLVVLAIAATAGTIGVAGYGLIVPSPRENLLRSRSIATKTPVPTPLESSVANPIGISTATRDKALHGLRHQQHQRRRTSAGTREGERPKESKNNAKNEGPKVAGMISKQEAQQGFERMMGELDKHIATGKKIPFKLRRELLEQSGRAFAAWSATLDAEQPGDAAELESAYVDFQMRVTQLELTAEPPPPKRKYPLE